MSQSRQPPARSSVETELSIVFAKIAHLAIPDVQGVSVVLVTPRGMTVQGAGSMNPRELGRALRQFADELDREASRQTGIVLPGDGRRS